MTGARRVLVDGGLPIRIAILTGCLVCGAAFAAPALAQASFQFVKDSSPMPVYWDAGSIKRDGDAFEVDVMQVYKTGPNKPLNANIIREKLSCTWSASAGGTLGRRTIDETGKVLNKVGPEPFTQGSFYGPHGWQAIIAPLVCDPAYKPAEGLTAAQALADAKSRPASKPAEGPRRAAAPPPESAAARLALVRSDSKTGNMSFIDWSRLSRQGDKITVQVFDALGDDTPPPPEPQWTYSVFALRSLSLDCKARTLAQTSYVTFTKYLEAGYPDAAPWPGRTAKDWPLGADILDAACGSKEPSKTFASRSAAIAHQRSVHPLKK